MGYRIMTGDMIVVADTLQETLAFVRGSEIVAGSMTKKITRRKSSTKRGSIDINKLIESLGGTSEENPMTLKNLERRTGYSSQGIMGKLKKFPNGRIKVKRNKRRILLWVS